MITNYFLNLAAGNLFGTQTTQSLPSNYYVGLSTTNPKSNGSGVTEPGASSGYSRVLLSDLSSPANGTVTNQKMIQFPRSKAGWNNIGYYVVFDALTGGHLLMGGSLPKSATITSNMTVIIKPGTVKLSVIDASGK